MRSATKDKIFGTKKFMEAEAGLLKVIVSSGKNLAVRDFISSDPYVVVKVGNQVSICMLLI